MCELPASLLPNVPRLLERFGGHWPCFHDASIERFDLDVDRACLALGFRVFQYGPVGADGFFAHENATFVVIRFDGLRATRLGGAVPVSSLDEFNITGDPGSFAVELIANDGLDGSFACDTLRELVVEPYHRPALHVSYLDAR